MESFHWGEHFVTGLSQVDEQHHQLVDIINEFGNLLAENEVKMEDIEILFKQLADYAVYHFQEEEQLMFRVKLVASYRKHHIEIHESFLDELTSIYAGISPENLGAAKYLLDFLTHWLAYHILGEDQHMARQIKAIQSGMSPSKAYDREQRVKDGVTEPLLVALNGLFEQVSIRNKELIQLNHSLEERWHCVPKNSLTLIYISKNCH